MTPRASQVPLNGERPLIASAFIRMARRYAEGVAITYDFIEALIRPMLTPAQRPSELGRLSDAYDLVGGYLWLSYRFADYFPDAERVRPLETEINDLYAASLHRIINGGSSKGHSL